MKRLLLLAGLVMATAVCACSGTSGKGNESFLERMFDDGKKEITVNGIVVKVDTFTANHYGENKIMMLYNVMNTSKKCLSLKMQKTLVRNCL